MTVPAVSHEPPGYACPFCAIAGGAEPEFTAWRGERVFVQIAKHWDPGGPGRALVIPTMHCENIYALPDDVAGRIARVVRLVATAMRRGYPCDGVAVRQNNEPAGGQDVWHLHTHVVPRHNDSPYPAYRLELADDAERARYAVRLRRSLEAVVQTPGST
ncbi:MAG: HIT family protein [Chloroflexi bacterium]|nr:HIT family protein [Chloroflexota bacterium]